MTEATHLCDMSLFELELTFSRFIRGEVDFDMEFLDRLYCEKMIHIKKFMGSESVDEFITSLVDGGQDRNNE